jgi:hypothetical protein
LEGKAGGKTTYMIDETYEDAAYREAYFERLARVKEIMAGDPDGDEGAASSIAREYASKFTCGDAITPRSGHGRPEKSESEGWT